MGRYLGFHDGSYTNEVGATLLFLRQFRPGYFTGLTVAQRAAGANMSVDVAIGDALISGTDRAFPVFIDTAAENVVISAANPTNPRHDIIVAWVDLSVVVNNPATPNTPGGLKLLAVAGTPAGTPADPSDGTIQTAVGASNPWIKLARVLVDASVGSIVTAKCTDLRTRSGLATNRLYGGASSTAGHLVPNVADDTVALLNAAQPVANKTIDNTNVVKSDGLSNPYKFLAYRNGALNSGNGAFAIIPFDTKIYDTGSNLDIVTNIGRFTAPIAGFYSFDACFNANTNNTNQTDCIALYKNGAMYVQGPFTQTPLTASPVGSQISATIQLAAGDYVEVFDYATVTQLLRTGSPMQVWFSGVLVSKT